MAGLDDLCVRFIVNIPAEELVSPERICFQIEEAQWFYEDFIRPADPSLPSLNLKTFFQRIVPRCPIFRDWAPQDVDGAFEKFLMYKNRVPVRGAILLNEKMDEVILVKGYKKSGTWSFPRGKINKDEDDLECAIREAWEETGYDIRAAGLVKDPRKIRSIEKTMRSQNMKMFVFRGVSKDAHFEPQTRKEISKIEWFRLADLPAERKKPQTEGTGQHLVLSANKFYVVAPFMHDLKRIITAERKKDRQTSRLAATSMAVDDAVLEPLPQSSRLDQQIMSPAIPSSLPELATPADPLLHLKQQLNIAPQLQPPPMDPAAKSNALLSLLRGGPTMVMRSESHAPFDQTTLSLAPPSPSRPAHTHLMANLQSPPPMLDLHQQMHPTAPPSSALPQLSQHTRSLLDAFRNPSPMTIQQPQPRLPDDKQNLLAAFTANISPSPALSSTAPSKKPDIKLLDLLKRPSSNTPNSSALPASPNVSARSPVPPTGMPTSMTPTTQIKGSDAPAANPLLDLFRGTQASNAPGSSNSNKRPVSYAAAAGSTATLASRGSAQPAPVELSAAADQELVAKNGMTAKNDLLSLLHNNQTHEIKRVTPKSRKGTTSATLDRPIDEPQFDAITRQSPYEEDVRREPATAERKLFDHKTGNIKHLPPTQVLLRHDERKNQPRSPRQAKQKQSSSPRRPLTPKETVKVFQPRILTRPQTRDGDDPMASLELPVKSSVEPDDLSDAPIAPEVPQPGPLSPSLNAPQAVESTVPFVHPDSIRRPSVILAPVHDPQKEALLSMLRGAPTSKSIDLDATPKAPSLPVLDPGRNDVLVSPTSIGHLISPVAEADLSSTPRSRVSSLASAANVAVGGRLHVEKRQTAAEDKAFLMQYLKGFASQVNS